MKSMFRRPGALAGGTAMVIAALALAAPAIASHPEASLAGSNFEIDVDANLKVDDPAPPSLDWANVIETRATDVATGQNDDSYHGRHQGGHELSERDDGQHPEQQERPADVPRLQGGRDAWVTRATSTWGGAESPIRRGTTLMDFEFNQSSTNCANGPNKLRTAGDLLIEYLIDQGGSRADITASDVDRQRVGRSAGPRRAQRAVRERPVRERHDQQHRRSPPPSRTASSPPARCRRAPSVRRSSTFA